jgi:hypothetical protein
MNQTCTMGRNTQRYQEKTSMEYDSLNDGMGYRNDKYGSTQQSTTVHVSQKMSKSTCRRINHSQAGQPTAGLHLLKNGPREALQTTKHVLVQGKQK